MPCLLLCPDPECRAPAEVLDRWTWPSTEGPVEHVRTRCLVRHVFTPPADTVIPIDAEAERELSSTLR